jgi:hypothetical protein
VEGLKKVAVAVRTHLAGPETEALLAALSGSAVFDLYVFAQETLGDLDFGPYAKISHSLRTIEELGFGKQYFYYLNHCSDVLFMHLLREAPGYDHYLMIEFDVHLTRGGPAFVDQWVRALSSPAYADVDMSTLAVRRSGPRWMWHAASAKFFAEPWACFFPWVSLTPRAIEHAFARRQQEWTLRGPTRPEANGESDNLIYCETFLPSAVAERGWRVIDIATMFPRCYVWSGFNEGPPRLLGDLQYDDPTVELIHPVVGPSLFLDKHAFWSRCRNRLPELVSELRAGRWALPSGLGAEWADKLEAEIQAEAPAP